MLLQILRGLANLVAYGRTDVARPSEPLPEGAVLRLAAARLGLDVTSPRRIAGRVAGRPVEVVEEEGLFGRIRIRIGGLPRDLEMARASGGIDIGDAAFDRLFRLEGDAPRARALLDTETRATLVSRWPGQTTLAGGRLERWVSEASPQSLARAVEETVALAAALAPEEDTVTRLARIARTDPTPAVRAGALRSLVALGAADRMPTADPDPAVRLAAAAALRDWDAVLALVADFSIEEEVRAEAVAHLRDAPAEAVLTGFLASLRSFRPSLPRAGIALVGETRCAAAVPWLAYLLGEGAPPATPHPLPLLERVRRRMTPEDEALRDAAAEALRQMGADGRLSLAPPGGTLTLSPEE